MSAPGVASAGHAVGTAVAFGAVDMETLPTLASALGRAPGAQPAPAVATTDGLFEREVGRALERSEETHLGERVAESRAAAIRARRSERDAGFDRSADDARPTQDSEADPAQGPIGVDPETPGREAVLGHGAQAPPAEPAPPGSSPSGESSPNTAPAGEARPATASPQVALPSIATVSAPVQAQAVAAGPAVPNAGGGAPSAAPSVEAVNASFLQAARGPRGATATPQLPAAAGDNALVDHAAEVLRQIRLAISPTAQRVVVDLHPDELGRLTIRMAMHDGRVSALVRAESPQTLELLERYLPELRAVLAERGLEAGNLELELGFGAEARGEERRSGAAPAFSGTARALQISPDEPASTAPVRTSVDGSVDTYA